jgi:hypothetical protein
MVSPRSTGVERSDAAPGARPTPAALIADPGVAAFYLLRSGFTVAPVLFGIDKFFNWMVDWPRYLWVGVADFFGGNAQQVMYGVGVVEIIAGLVVLIAPMVGAGLVAAWLGVIIVNLVIIGAGGGVPAGAEYARPEYWDIALRDFGLMIGAVALFLLSNKYQRA